jgi:ABC-2 type transport system ATP-binding protein
MTVLYTTHYMEEAQELSHRVGIIDHGQIIAVGTIGELIQKVGEKDTLIFKVPDVPAGLTERLMTIEGVEQVKAQEGEVNVVARRGRKALPEAIRILGDCGVALNSVEIKEPNLEAVFLQLTGRALRD